MKLTFFPLTPEVETIARYPQMMRPHTIDHIVSFQEDRARLAALEKVTGILCTAETGDGLRSCDALVLTDNFWDAKWDKYYACMEHAASRAVPVFASPRLIRAMPDREKAGSLQTMTEEHSPHITSENDRLFEIKTPIVAVAGLGANCGKFECQIQLKHHVESMGYRPLCISANSLAAYVGMESLPEFLFEQTLSFPQKVSRINHFLYDLCAKNKPDVLIIGMPGGLLPISEKDTNFYGEIPLVLSAALRIDACVLGFYYRNQTTDDYLQRIAAYHQQKLRLPIAAFYMARQMAIYDPNSHQTQFLFLSDDYIRQHRPEICGEIEVAVPLADHTKIYNALMKNLQQNLETV